jgi:uncharacterized integral membrane protein
MMRRFGVRFRSYLQASWKHEINIVGMIRRLIYLLTAIGWTPGGSSTVQIYTKTIHRTTQLTTLVGRFSGIRTQIGQSKINDERTS